MSGNGNRRFRSGDSGLPKWDPVNTDLYKALQAASPSDAHFPGGIVIRDMPIGTDAEAVRKEFLKFGPIMKVVVEDFVTIDDSHSINITFKNESDARRAICQTDNKKILGSRVRVHYQLREPYTEECFMDMAEKLGESRKTSEEEAKKKKQKEAEEAAEVAKAASAETAKKGAPAKTRK